MKIFAQLTRGIAMTALVSLAGNAPALAETFVYAIDPSSGALKALGKYPTGKDSNWVEIVSFD